MPALVPLALASSSPRRLALLRQIGVEPFAIIPPEIDETPRPRELPRAYAARVAIEKAQAARGTLTHACAVLAADTVVACGRRILPKAEAGEPDVARRCLELLSGRRHRVHGGVAVIDAAGELRTRLVVTIVHMKRLTPQEIDAYLASGEWQGKAGGYAIQGRAAAFIPQINGSYTNVVGLPLTETVGLLRAAGCVG